MRSKYRRRPPPPPPRGSPRMSQVLVGLVLVLGAALALSVERLVSNTPVPETQATAAPSAPPSVASSPPASAQAAASTAPSASPSPAATVLEAEMPHSINGTTLTIRSATNAASLGSDSSSRALG